MHVYYLEPTGPIHVGGGALQGCLARSDTISAALLSVWRHVAPQDDLTALALNPPYAVSSALPWMSVAPDRMELFFPAPPGILDSAMLTHPDQRKAWKKIGYVSAPVLELAARSLAVDPTNLAVLDNGHLLAHFDTADLPHRGVFRSRRSRLRVSVNRINDGPLEGALFESQATRFSASCGFAIVAEVKPELEEIFEAALRLLGDEGLGQDRTSGQGSFRVKAREALKPPGAGTGRRLLLSLYRPTIAEVERGVLDNGAYSLLERGGWVTAPGESALRRNPVRMLEEGSLMGDVGGLPMGEVVQVLSPMPDLGLHHPVYRDGRALWFPCGPLGEGDE